MRAVVQRVQSARVVVEGKVVGRCSKGLLVLAAAHREDTETNALKLADRIVGLRIFGDSQGKMNLNLADACPGEEPNVLAISNFTLYGDSGKSRRPSFTESAPYAEGERLFEQFVQELAAKGARVEQGVFGAHMDVELLNDGPVTLILDA